MTIEKRGGKREGAGRKVIPGTIMKSVKLTPEHWEQAKILGKGNAARGIRLSIAAAMKMFNIPSNQQKGENDES